MHLVDTVCTASGYHTICTSSIVEAVAVRFYEQQCQPSSVYAFPACQKPPENRALLGEGVLDSICNESYCGCSSSPTSRMLYIFEQ